MKGFHIGLFTGTLFANKYTSSLYDGYGFDPDGNKNIFQNSFMNRRINIENGGYYGGPDRIAQALGVNHSDWSFSETDMSTNLKYNVAFMVGFNSRYCFNNKDAIIFNVNGSKLTLNGNFTITINNPYGGQPAIRTCSIIGGEQRLLMQIGYQRIMGDNDKFNFFMEGGFTLSLAKYLSNQINITGTNAANSLTLDLSGYYSQPLYNSFRAKGLTGVGPGLFAGMGINMSISPKWTIQLLYQPSYELINIGDNPKHKLQNALGLRAYYNF